MPAPHEPHKISSAWVALCGHRRPVPQSLLEALRVHCCSLLRLGHTVRMRPAELSVARDGLGTQQRLPPAQLRDRQDFYRALRQVALGSLLDLSSDEFGRCQWRIETGWYWRRRTSHMDAVNFTDLAHFELDVAVSGSDRFAVWLPLLTVSS